MKDVRMYKEPEELDTEERLKRRNELFSGK